MQKNELLSWALYYASAGLRVLPCEPKGKRPLTAHGVKDASTDADQIRTWWSRWPEANIGISMGTGSGLVDIESDVKSDKTGEEALQAWTGSPGGCQLPATWAFRSGGGGIHRLFRCGVELGNRVNMLPAVDVRGSGGYSIFPPSLHPSGRPYEWLPAAAPGDIEPAPLPLELLSLIRGDSSNGRAPLEIPGSIQAGSRNDLLFRMAAKLRRDGFSEQEIIAAVAQANRERCSPPLGDGEIRQICHSVTRYAPASSVRPGDLSDAGNAESFAKIVRGRLLWCDALGWLVWNGKRWDPDEHRATALAIGFAQQLLTDALERYKAALDPETGKATEDAKRYLAHAQRTRGAVSIKNLLTLAKSWLAIRADKLDASWWLLNTDAGLVDLRTGEVRPHDPAALCTRIAPFSPTSEGVEIWTDFLELITGGNKALEDYLQVKTGSYAFGKIFQEGVDFAVGGGRNGKSTLFNALAAVLGDYAGGIDATVLTTEKQNRGAALATLRGKRLILCGELEEGQRLSVQTLKRLATTDQLTIEEKYRQPETIRPSHHIVLFSNFLPRVGSTDAGTWRRISVIPFNETMPEGCADIPNYADILIERAGGAILSWIIEGAVAFHKAGYRVQAPVAVQEATDHYRQSEDWIKRYLSERCVLDPAARVRGGELYADYRAFAQMTGDYCRRGNDFTKALEGLGYKRQILHGRTTWIGLRVDYAQDFPVPSGQRYG